MSDLIVSCAGCGKRYKGSSSAKKFKCGDCNNVFTYPDSVRIPAPNKTFCTQCWTELDITPDLSECPSCAQRVSPNVIGRATVSLPGSSSGSGHQAQTGASAELLAQLAALTKERDELLEIRRKQDKTMGNLLEQLAFAKAHKTKDEVEDSAKWELQMEIGEHKSRVAALEEEKRKLLEERVAGGGASDDLQARIAELEAAVAASEPLQARIAELETQLAEAKSAAPDPAVAAEHDDARRKLEMRVAELEEQLAKLEEGQALAERERIEAVGRADKAQGELEEFRQAAVQAIEPLGAECNRAFKQLLADSDTMMESMRKKLLESNKVFESELESCSAIIKDQINTLRRDTAERFANVLGAPSEISGQLPAIPSSEPPSEPASGQADSPPQPSQSPENPQPSIPEPKQEHAA